MTRRTGALFFFFFSRNVLSIIKWKSMDERCRATPSDFSTVQIRGSCFENEKSITTAAD